MATTDVAGEDDGSSSPSSLIPGLPDDLAASILASLPPPSQSHLRSISRRWRSLLLPSSLVPLRRRLRLPPYPLLCVFSSDPSLTPPLLFDPSAAAWLPLRPLPCSPHSYALSNFSALPYLSGNVAVLGGSLFDARTYPLNHPSPSSAAFLYEFETSRWRRLPDMLSPRGGFACAVLPDTKCIIVAGGGSRHLMFPSNGSRTRAVEVFDLDRNEWTNLEMMPRCRAGCVGFVRGREIGGEDEFWVMGGYGEYLTVGGVVPADVYCKDAFVYGLSSGRWREVGDMWAEGERTRMGKLVTVEGLDGRVSRVYMLDGNNLFRYDFELNRWLKESNLRRHISEHESCGFAAMNGELYILTTTRFSQVVAGMRQPKKRPGLEIQVYNPDKKHWRFLTANLPFNRRIDFRSAVLCTVQV